MGDLNEFPLAVRLFLKAYPWRKIDPVPWTPLKKPLTRCRLALITSAAFVLPEQKPFDESIRGGDYSFREIPGDADVHKLVESHRSESFDHTGILRDPNVAFPIDRSRELAERPAASGRRDRSRSQASRGPVAHSAIARRFHC